MWDANVGKELRRVYQTGATWLHLTAEEQEKIVCTDCFMVQEPAYAHSKWGFSFLLAMEIAWFTVSFRIMAKKKIILACM